MLTEQRTVAMQTKILHVNPQEVCLKSILAANLPPPSPLISTVPAGKAHAKDQSVSQPKIKENENIETSYK